MASGKSDQKKAGDKHKARQSFLLRVSPGLLAELRSWAGDEVRSLNGHIEYLLRDAVRKRKRKAED